ncbi:UV radiation resistance protein and autophagy-related subunit 14-domain-containing protein [Aspergillus unguis]
MSCDICTRPQASALLCPTCARNRLYQLRVNKAGVLLEREYLSHQIETALNQGESNHEVCSTEVEKQHVSLINGPPRLLSLRRIGNERVQSSTRIEAIRNQIQYLRSRIKTKNEDIFHRKNVLARRRSDSESAVYQLSERETGALSGIQNINKRMDHIWHSNHTKMAEARIFLCREAASLYGLRQRIRKRDNSLKETYMIGGMSILDLRELNSASPSHISTSFSYLAHILVLVSNYLSLRLPAEITLPHKSYPAPTIYTPSASYLHRELHSWLPNHLSSSSPTTSRTAEAHAFVPRPRPLCIDKALPKLAKEDPGTYALFVEGVSLLAWNVSWLCRSQGLNLGSDSWEDVCDVGKNMWQLLVAPPGQSTLARALAGRETQTKMKPQKDFPRTTIQRTKSFPMLGHYSHGTAHSFLGASEGAEFMRSWKLPTPTKVADRLKSTLLGEMATAEWELLEEKEWDDIPPEPSQPVSHEPENGSDPTRGIGTGGTKAETSVSKPDTPDTPAAITVQPKGTSGWTKIRNR